MAFLELTNVSKSFGGACVLKEINLSIAQGEFVAIVGFSGAGKTTLINLVAGLTRPDSGSATLNELAITGPGPDRGIVFQNYSLLPWLTVYENVFLAVDQVFPNWSPAKKQQHTEAHIPAFKRLRRDLIEFMLNSKHERHTSITRKLILPDIEPEDLDRTRPRFAGRHHPKRRSEIKQETVEVA